MICHDKRIRPNPPEGLDLTPRSSSANLAALVGALDELDARLRTAAQPERVAFPLDPGLLASGNSWTLVTRLGDLDLVLEPAGTRGYEDLISDADLLAVAEGPRLEVHVASLADVIRSKDASGRAKDHAMLPLLRSTLEEIDLG